MQQILHRNYKNLFYVKTTENLTRTSFSDVWAQYPQNNKDVIVKTTKGFLIKSDQEKQILNNILNILKETKTIKDFTETQNKSGTTSTSTPSATYAAVIAAVDHEITDEELSTHLKSQNFEHRYCKRITSRITGQKTKLIRFITGNIKTFEQLLTEGIYYKHRHHPVYPSQPPPPLPVPCARCSEFSHITENCKNQIKCSKCLGTHHTNKCQSSQLPKCLACNSEEHVAWSIKCPKRPKQPIEGIPNIKIKCINKKSHEIEEKITKKSRVHKPLTIHDYILDTYTNEINQQISLDRKVLIEKLKKRFADNFKIDTTVVFSGSRMYILMFDLENPTSEVATQPTYGIQADRHIQ